MKIMIINPTSTEAFAVKNLEAGQSVAAVGTEIMSTTPNTAPASIEGHYDEAIATIGILEQVQKGERLGVDGYVVACFGDPGVLA
ncbi:MAG: aspartate/glutamate racemase family protein, partial [Alphaproteobacteria bacterium]|nr:aspartate/glutamate racemase family protein [Alphaproteobacteria bacterium]